MSEKSNDTDPNLRQVIRAVYTAATAWAVVVLLYGHTCRHADMEMLLSKIRGVEKKVEEQNLQRLKLPSNVSATVNMPRPLTPEDNIRFALEGLLKQKKESEADVDM